jgi:hypothetical protein
MIVSKAKALGVVLLVTTAACAGDDLFPLMTEPAEVSVKLGKHQDILTSEKAGISYFPDEPICILRKNPLVFTAVGTDGCTFLMQGTTLQSARPVQKLLCPGPAGSIDNNYAGVAAMYHDKPRKRWIGLYHAEDKEGIGMIKETAVNGFYGTIAAIEVSPDLKTTKRLGAAITADLPKLLKGWEQYGGPPGAWLAQGVGTPTVAISPDGSSLYCWYTEYSNRVKGNTRRGVQICMARAPLEDAGVPGTWTKYHNGRFSEPGLGGHDTPVVRSNTSAETYDPHVCFIDDWNCYVMVFGCGAYADIFATPPKAITSGLFLTTSSDGVLWSKPTRLETVFPLVIVTQECKVHPMLMIYRTTDSKITGLLTYGYTPKWPEVSHYLGGCPITITRLPADERAKPLPAVNLTNRLKGTKWVNTNKATFEWTPDGRLLHNNKERQWRVLDENRVEITFDPSKKATLIFDKYLTRFDQPLGDGKKFEGRRTDTVTPPTASKSPSLADRLKGTRWIREGQPNNVFEWTGDGRLLQNGGGRKWKVLDERSAEVRVGERVDRWVFADDLKTVVQHGDGGKWKSTWVRAD